MENETLSLRKKVDIRRVFTLSEQLFQANINKEIKIKIKK